jgi:GT2 family glycosyltransferase
MVNGEGRAGPEAVREGGRGPGGPDSRGIVVVVLTFNQKDTTLACLESLERVSDPPFQVVLWDNASRDGTIEAVAERFPRVVTRHSPENLGVASGRNRAAELAISRFDPEYLMFLDNDTIVTPGFLGGLRRAL